MAEKKPIRRKALTQREPLDDADLMERHRQCPATSKRTGERCKRFCAQGQRTCRFHGSATRRAKTAAAKRIAQASGYAAEMLVEFMADPEVDVQLRTRIAQDLLDRSGVNSKQVLELTVEKGRSFDDVIEASLIEVGTPDEIDVLDAVIVEEDDEPEPPVQNRHDRAAFREHDRARQSPPEAEQEPAAAVRAIPKDKPKRSEDDAANQRSREAYMEAIAAGHSTAYARRAAERAVAAETQSGPRYARRARRNDED